MHLQTRTDFNLIQSRQNLNTLLIRTAELTLLSLIIPKPLLKPDIHCAIFVRFRAEFWLVQLFYFLSWAEFQLCRASFVVCRVVFVQYTGGNEKRLACLDRQSDSRKNFSDNWLLWQLKESYKPTVLKRSAFSLTAPARNFNHLIFNTAIKKTTRGSSLIK